MPVTGILLQYRYYLFIVSRALPKVTKVIISRALQSLIKRVSKSVLSDHDVVKVATPRYPRPHIDTAHSLQCNLKVFVQHSKKKIMANIGRVEYECTVSRQCIYHSRKRKKNHCYRHGARVLKKRALDF